MEKSEKKNEKLEKFIKKTADTIRYSKEKYNKVKELVNNTPILIKILNISVPFSITYIFTFIYYNLSLSILFSLITLFVILLLSKLFAIIYITIYILSLINIIQARNITIGNPIPITDIVKSKSPYVCLNQSLMIPSNELAQDLYGGYFTYSFWLYIDNSTTNVNDQANWYNYRYNEWKSVFYRGSPINNSGDISQLLQFPGVWLTPVLNNMVIVFQNSSYVERIEINDIPFNTWINYSIVVETRSVSIYINGKLDRSLNLYQNISIMNNFPLYLTSDILMSKNKNECGFAGSLAELIFYNYALSPSDIYNSYNYYKKIIYKYQQKINKNNYSIPGLITNSDYYSYS